MHQSLFCYWYFSAFFNIEYIEIYRRFKETYVPKWFEFKIDVLLIEKNHIPSF